MINLMFSPGFVLLEIYDNLEFMQHINNTVSNMIENKIEEKFTSYNGVGIQINKVDEGYDINVVFLKAE